VLWHCWLGIRKSILPLKNDELLVWLSVWSEVQIVCIWSSWCHCHPKTPSSLASFISRLVLPFWYWLTQVILEKRLLTHTHTCLTAICPGLPRQAGTRRQNQSGFKWSKRQWVFAPRSRQITMPAPHHSVFYRPDALPAAQPTASEHWRQKHCFFCVCFIDR